MPHPKHRLGFVAGNPNAAASIDYFVDVLCPFSRKGFLKLPEILAHYGDRIHIRLHMVPQPWHPQGGYAARSVLAAGEISDEMAWKMTAKVYENLESWSDEKTDNMTAIQLYDRCGDYAAELGLDKAAFIESMRSANVTQQVKFACRFHRQNAIHMTPSILVNGIPVYEFGSAWNLEQFQQLLDPVVA
eukprot:TRINITY_DN3032_c0_g1_i1.p1 TRINITY_DN3032_c0_g1~~TRINITY_DN3032_c0_g1_i1.p1  ORF type:complete len:188 (-),score=66.00 TRINITY_DN3032_c0_g1_i1:184-747(-)